MNERRSIAQKKATESVTSASLEHANAPSFDIPPHPDENGRKLEAAGVIGGADMTIEVGMGWDPDRLSNLYGLALFPSKVLSAC